MPICWYPLSSENIISIVEEIWMQMNSMAAQFGSVPHDSQATW